MLEKVLSIYISPVKEMFEEKGGPSGPPPVSVLSSI
jgi:hypothetical protein